MKVHAWILLIIGALCGAVIPVFLGMESSYLNIILAVLGGFIGLIIGSWITDKKNKS